jgi:hypothetical protein
MRTLNISLSLSARAPLVLPEGRLDRPNTVRSRHHFRFTLSGKSAVTHVVLLEIMCANWIDLND